MQLNYITSEDWTTLEKRYPSAAAYLLHQSLYRERIALNIELGYLVVFFNTPDERNKMRCTWLQQRIAELDTLTLEDKSIIKEQEHG
jgi:hypothetical protein